MSTRDPSSWPKWARALGSGVSESSDQAHGAEGERGNGSETRDSRLDADRGDVGATNEAATDDDTTAPGDDTVVTGDDTAMGGDAATGDDEHRDAPSDEARVDRAAFLRESAGILGGVTRRLGAVVLSRVADRVAPVLMRPPGAVPEELFVERCTRCGECVDACHQDSILIADGDKGLQVHTPYLDVMNHKPCYLCTHPPCIEVCPSEALLPTRPEDFRLGTARIVHDDCLAWQGEECSACVERCPYTGTAILADADGRPWVDAEACTGCGLCHPVCPAESNAIVIEPPLDD